MQHDEYDEGQGTEGEVVGVQSLFQGLFKPYMDMKQYLQGSPPLAVHPPE